MQTRTHVATFQFQLPETYDDDDGNGDEDGDDETQMPLCLKHFTTSRI